MFLKYNSHWLKWITGRVVDIGAGDLFQIARHCSQFYEGRDWSEEEELILELLDSCLCWIPPGTWAGREYRISGGKSLWTGLGCSAQPLPCLAVCLSTSLWTSLACSAQPLPCLAVCLSTSLWTSLACSAQPLPCLAVCLSTSLWTSLACSAQPLPCLAVCLSTSLWTSLAWASSPAVLVVMVILFCVWLSGLLMLQPLLVLFFIFKKAKFGGVTYTLASMVYIYISECYSTPCIGLTQFLIGGWQSSLISPPPPQKKIGLIAIDLASICTRRLHFIWCRKWSL